VTSIARLVTPAALAAVVRRPDLWPTAVVAAFRLAPTGWWRRRPWVPLPDERYLAFRLETAYGSAVHPAEAEDLVAYLEWARQRWRSDRRPGRYR